MTTTIERVAVLILSGFFAMFLIFLLYLLPTLRINLLWLDNADALYVESVARDLLKGGHLADWRLSQAAYIFPDIALTLLFVPLTSIGRAAQYAQLANLILGITGWYLVARRCGLRNGRPALVCLVYGTLFCTSFVSYELHSNVALYFGVVPFHSAVGVMLPWMALVSLSLMTIIRRTFAEEPTCYDWLIFTSSVVFLLLLAISDDTFIICFMIPVSLIMLYTATFRSAMLDTPKLVFAGLLLAIVLAAQILHLIIPFPQKFQFEQNVFHEAIRAFPLNQLESARNFFHLIVQSYFTFFVMVLAAAGAIIIFSSPSAHPIYPIAIAFVAGTVLLPFLEIAMGMFIGFVLSREWSGAFLGIITFGSLVLLSNENVRSAALVMASVLLVLAWQVAVLARAPKQTYTSAYAALSRCFKAVIPHADFVADYWDAVPLSLHSEGSLRGLPILGGNFQAFTVTQNISRLRRLEPTFALIGENPEHAQLYEEKFGAPDRKASCGEWEIWDYSGNAQFRRFFKDAARASG